MSNNVLEIEAWSRCVLNDWVHTLERKFIDLHIECKLLKGRIKYQGRLLLESQKLVEHNWDLCNRILTVLNALIKKEESLLQQIERLEKENKELKSFRNLSDLLSGTVFCKARKQLEDLERWLNQKVNMEIENLRKRQTSLREQEKINYSETEIAGLNGELRGLEKIQEYLRVLCPDDVYSMKRNKSRNFIDSHTYYVFSALFVFFLGVFLLLFVM